MNSSFKLISINDFFIFLMDQDKGKSVTNDAQNVIWRINQAIPEGIGNRIVYYQDTDGRIDQLKIKDGVFDGFAPCSESQQTKILEMPTGGNCFICDKYDEKFNNGICSKCDPYIEDFIKNY